MRADAVENRRFLDPVLRATGQIRADPGVLDALVQDGDLATVSAPLDDARDPVLRRHGRRPRQRSERPLYPRRTPWQQAHPEGMYGDARPRPRRLPGRPSARDRGERHPEPHVEGTTDDAERVEFLLAHLQQVARAVDAGVDVRAYYAWSLLDNFEWAEGWTLGDRARRLRAAGRTPKNSARWYADVVAQPAVPPA